MNVQVASETVGGNTDPRPRSRPASSRRPLCKYWAWLGLCSIFFALTPARANPIIDGYITLDTVVISAFPQSFANVHDETDTSSYLAVIASPYYGNVRMLADTYWDYLEYVAALKTNAATTPDVRCNINATAATRNTTSHAEPTDRYLSTLQLFNAIKSVNNAVSLRGILRDSASTVYNGKSEFTFRVTYADGVSESWIVLGGGTLNPQLVIEGNLPGMIPGDGIVKNCPTTSGG